MASPSPRAWKALYDQITDAAPAPRPFRAFSGTARPAASIPLPSPTQPSQAFIDYASEVQFTVKPNDLHKQVARCWNRAKERVPGWPQTTLTVPDFRPKAASLPWDAFLPSFVEDVERYLARLGGESLLDEDAPDRACKPSTIETSTDLPEARRLSRREAGCAHRRRCARWRISSRPRSCG